MSKSGIVNVRMVITEEKILMNIDKVQKLIDDTIPSIISQLNIKKDRVKKATREQFNISAKTKSNTTIYC